jgi:hypothetical protein
MPRKTTNQAADENALVISDFDNLLAPAEGRAYDAEDAGAGSADIDASTIILPRALLLQGLSPAIADELPGAKQGRWWLTPYNRPITTDDHPEPKIVVIRVYNSQRLWTPKDQGGGIVCEAAEGDHTAREPNGLKNASIVLDEENGTAIGLRWEGGQATDNCRLCVYGPGASATAGGRRPNPAGRLGSAWLPKTMVIDGKSITIPNEHRGPKCTASVDALVLVFLPEFEGMPGTVQPCILSFSRSSMKAGNQLASQLKMASQEPAWARIWKLGSKKVKNDKGTFYVATVGVHAHANSRLVAMAKDLYINSQTKTYRADDETMSNGNTVEEENTKSGPRVDDGAAPDDAF